MGKQFKLQQFASVRNQRQSASQSESPLRDLILKSPIFICPIGRR